MIATAKRIPLYIIIALVIVLVAGGVIISSLNHGSPVSVSELLSLGEKYLLDLDYEQALVQFLKVIEIEPMNPRGYTGAAEAYIGLGDTESAIAILELAPVDTVPNEDAQELLNTFVIKENGDLPAPSDLYIDDDYSFYWTGAAPWINGADNVGYIFALMNDNGDILHADHTGYNGGRDSVYSGYLPLMFGGVWENWHDDDFDGLNRETPSIGQHTYTLMLYAYKDDAQGNRMYTACPTKFSVSVTVEAAMSITNAVAYDMFDIGYYDLYVFSTYDQTSEYLLTDYDDTLRHCYSTSDDFRRTSGPTPLPYATFGIQTGDNPYFSIQRFSDLSFSSNNISFTMTVPQTPLETWQKTDVDPANAVYD